MNKILNAKEAQALAKKLKQSGKTIIVAGGVFDILHVGHLRFLKKAKEIGDVLLILLESDKAVKKNKGNARPINNQKNRAEILEGLIYVDYIIAMEDELTNEEYDTLIAGINPDIIAVTRDSPTIKHAKRQSAKTGSKAIEVISRIDNQSTTKIANIISKSF